MVVLAPGSGMPQPLLRQGALTSAGPPEPAPPPGMTLVLPPVAFAPPLGTLAEPPAAVTMKGGGGVVRLPSLSSVQPPRPKLARAASAVSTQPCICRLMAMRNPAECI